MKLSLQSMRLTLAAVLLLLCSGCGYLFGDHGVFRDKSEDYKKSQEVPVLKVPRAENSSPMTEIYPIPPISNYVLLAGKFEVPRPAPLVAGVADEMVRIQSLGSDSWALVSTAPGQVWPQVRSFLSASQIDVSRVDAREGILETTWLDLEGAPMASRFRIQIDQGVQRGTSELHVLQMNQAGDLNSWPAASDNSDQAKEMLQALAQYIANIADSTPVSMMANQAISATGKISVQEGPDNDVYIRLTLPYDRAWASVERALEESSFEISDRDRSAGRYYVRFLGPKTEDEDGWFDWLLDSDSDDPLAGRDFIVSVESLDDKDVAIRVDPPLASDQNDPPVLEKKDEQALLALIKGNID